jgi:NADPH:quinone reductase-like Zn-dependent oxidoreductase
VIIYTKRDFIEETRNIIDRNGADYIIDVVGESTLTGDLEAVSTDGKGCRGRTKLVELSG